MHTQGLEPTDEALEQMGFKSWIHQPDRGRSLSDISPFRGGTDHRYQLNCERTNTYPYHSVVDFHTRTGNSLSWCSGTLIGENIVLTAAHCLYNFENQQWSYPQRVTPAACDGRGKRNEQSSIPYWDVSRVSITSSWFNRGRAGGWGESVCPPTHSISYAWPYAYGEP